MESKTRLNLRIEQELVDGLKELNRQGLTNVSDQIRSVIRYYLAHPLDEKMKILSGERPSEKIPSQEGLSEKEESFYSEFIKKAATKTLLGLLRNEDPQTISMILANLEPGRASQIIEGLEPDTQLEVVKRIAKMEDITPEVLKLLYTSMKATVSKGRIGGPALVAELLNRMDTSVRQELIDRSKQDDPELAKEIKALLFVFDDLKYVDKRGIQRIVSAIRMDLELITRALKAANDDVKGKFLEVLSPGARETMEKDMQDIPIPLKDALEAQQQILIAASESLENGEIRIDRTGNEEEILLL